MQRSLAAGAVLSLAFLPFALTQNSATPAADVIVLEQPGNQWYEGPLPARPFRSTAIGQCSSAASAARNSIRLQPAAPTPKLCGMA